MSLYLFLCLALITIRHLSAFLQCVYQGMVICQIQFIPSLLPSRTVIFRQFSSKFMCSYMSLFVASNLGNEFDTNRARSLSLMYILSQKQCALFTGKFQQKQDQLESIGHQIAFRTNLALVAQPQHKYRDGFFHTSKMI